MTCSLLFHVALTEMRLTFRNLGYWLYLLSITVLSVIVVLSAPQNSWLETVVHIANNGLFFQFPLLAIVIAPALTRHRSLSREWIWATCLDYPLLWLGQLLGLVVVFFISSLVPIIVASIGLLLHEPTFGMYLPVLWRLALTLLLPVTFLEISIVFALVCWFRNVALTIASVTALDLLLWLGVFMPVASLTTPLNHTLLTLHLDHVAGLGAEQSILSRLLFFYVALGCGLILTSIWGSAQLSVSGESRPRHKFYLLCGMVTGLVCLALAFWGYTASVQLTVAPPPPTSVQHDAWTVEESSHRGSISGVEIDLKSEFVLRNTGNAAQQAIMLSLNTGQRCIAATLDDAAVPCRRDGEFVEILSPAPIPPDGRLGLEIVYSGVPILLREDYALVKGVRGDNPVSYQNPVRTFVDDNVMYLHRDGNWLAWPLTTLPHISSHDAMTLEVARAGSVVSSGQMVEQTASHVTYQWNGKLPQILFISTPFQMIERAGDTITLGYYSGEVNLDKAQAISQLVRMLEQKIGRDSGAHYHVVVLPYAQEVVVSGSLIGFAEGTAPRSFNTSAGLYGLALDVARAWLIDHITWPKEIGVSGHLRSASTICALPDETGHRECETVSLGGINPQAPDGRLIEKDSQDSLLPALSAALALWLSEDFTGDAAFTQSVYEQWARDAECTDATIFAPEKYQNARWALAIYDLFGETGSNGVAQMLRTLTQEYTMGSAPLTKREFLQMADHRGYVLKALEQAPSCPIALGLER
jgi:hypothetical protein